ncbi:hypothetical protein F0562_023074 [Nyssa sinensis]|uniref:Uncharacterized protein n=1 Tax=Nyssa sinensis TaxID=561372 RepID=A0A5J5BJN9_9ASTE|nr:hypothetical protein F0562_023074 [Nyssa sinensis]
MLSPFFLGEKAEVSSSDFERCRFLSESLKLLDETISIKCGNSDMTFELGVQYVERWNLNAVLRYVEQFANAAGGSVLKDRISLTIVRAMNKARMSTVSTTFIIAASTTEDLRIITVVACCAIPVGIMAIILRPEANKIRRKEGISACPQDGQVNEVGQPLLEAAQGWRRLLVMWMKLTISVRIDALILSGNGKVLAAPSVAMSESLLTTETRADGAITGGGILLISRPGPPN